MLRVKEKAVQMAGVKVRKKRADTPVAYRFSRGFSFIAGRVERSLTRSKIEQKGKIKRGGRMEESATRILCIAR